MSSGLVVSSFAPANKDSGASSSSSSPLSLFRQGSVGEIVGELDPWPAGRVRVVTSGHKELGLVAVECSVANHEAWREVLEVEVLFIVREAIELVDSCSPPSLS
eukprot:3389257-Amphidinium_carterae.1